MSIQISCHGQNMRLGDAEPYCPNYPAVNRGIDLIAENPISTSYTITAVA